ncbi:BREX-4 system phosphatase PglZ [Thermodesulfatator autotrophicus]|uniref:PglZ domain-containing protein n=1 Tax=Thermodesulfatator autotrophicus TaxID=1795632 RepID=A0A177E6T7_9BACT|nr:BREX-4 system phosphatase PglZ [Thermodesulfatator autotrophicus]OAG27654.1 hypothetical protein TH606_05955 [Thermodesulfatator autotrophicus]
MLTFYKLEDLKEELEKELKAKHRFPAIFLIFKNQLSFKKILDFLQIKTEVLTLNQFCQGEDLAPHLTLEGIKSFISSKGPLTIIPFCAWLRLGLGAPEVLLKRLADLQSKNLPRLVVPLLDYEETISSLLQELSRLSRNEGAKVFKLEEKTDEFKLFVSPPIEGFKPLNKKIVNGLKNYFKYWTTKEVSNNIWLFTKKFKGIKPNNTIKVFASPKEIIAYFNKNIEVLPEWPDEFWLKLLKLINKCQTYYLDEIIKKFFKVENLIPQKLIEKIEAEEDFGKYLLIFWAKNKNQDQDDIWLGILASCHQPDEIGERLYCAPLELSFDLDFLKKRKTILKKLKFSPSNPEKRLSEDYYRNLAVLTDLTHQEKLLTINFLEKIITKEEFFQKIKEVLKINYPLLAYYFEDIEIEGKKYFSTYRKAKVNNKYPHEWPEIKVESFPSRENVLEKLKVPPERQVWIDGLGGEWLGVFYRLISLTGKKFHIKLARANLPTITETNKPPQGALFLRDLDNTGHDYLNNSQEYLLKELDVLQKLWQEIIVPLLSENKSLVITADHGLTWKGFHSQLIDLPKGAKDPHRGGRVAHIEYLSEEITTSDFWKTDKEDKYVCLKRHGLFKGAKRTSYGEGHGGALPEEVLVPIIEILPETIEDFVFELITRQCQKNTKGEITLEVKITPEPRQKIKALLRKKELIKEIELKRVGNSYKALITNIPEGKYEIELLIGQQKAKKDFLEVLPAPFTEEDLGL